MLTSLLLVLTLLAMSATQADTALSPEMQRGLDIFQEADARLSGYGDLAVALQMTLRTARGRSSERHLRISQLEVVDDGDKVMVVFDTPADIRGTALLSHTHKIEDDDQWLYLPAIKRVKKITSRNKTRAFVGSEFSFEDLALPELEKYNYRFLREEELDGQLSFVVERISKNKYSGYTSEVFWFDQEAYRILRVEYFDHQEMPVKVLTVSGYQLFEERFWKANRMYMENLRTGKSTELLWSDYSFGVGLGADRDFSVASLRRAR